MLPEVVKAVAKVKHNLSGLAGHNPDETNTKNSLINPILRSLGWDESDWERVKAEFQLQEHIKHKVDYALMDRSGTPRAFVEAKRLRDSLSGEAQLHSYVSAYLGDKGFQAAEEFACIVFTNGREWRFYPVNAQKGRQYYDGWYGKIDLAKEDPEQCAKSLSLLLSESRICDGRAKQQLTAEFKEQHIAREWQRMITQPDEALVRLLRKRLKDYGVSKEEAAQAIRDQRPKRPDEKLPDPPADEEGTVPSSEDNDRRRTRPRPRLQVTVGGEEFDSAHFPYIIRMLPSVLKAIMELKAISGQQLVQTCLEAKITGYRSLAWVVSADMLAELRNSQHRETRRSARASKAINEQADYFVLTNHSTEAHGKKLEKLGLALGLDADLKVHYTPDS